MWCRHRTSAAHKAHRAQTAENGSVDEMEPAVVENWVLVDLGRKSVVGDVTVELAGSHSDEASAAPSEVDCSDSDSRSCQGWASMQKSLRDCDHVHHPTHPAESRARHMGLVAVQLKGCMVERQVFPLIEGKRWSDGVSAPGRTTSLES